MIQTTKRLMLQLLSDLLTDGTDPAALRRAIDEILPPTDPKADPYSHLGGPVQLHHAPADEWRYLAGGWRINHSTDTAQYEQDGAWEHWGTVAEFERWAPTEAQWKQGDGNDWHWAHYTVMLFSTRPGIDPYYIARFEEDSSGEYSTLRLAQAACENDAREKYACLFAAPTPVAPGAGDGK